MFLHALIHSPKWANNSELYAGYNTICKQIEKKIYTE